MVDDLISKLSEIRSDYNCFNEDEEPQYRALSEAIRILSQRADGDTISRRAAIDAMCELMRHWFGGDPKDEVREINRELKNLPPAQPKRGKWIYGEDSIADGVDGYRCDQCGFFVPWDYTHKSIDYIKDYNFCPKCGSYNGGEQDG